MKTATITVRSKTTTFEYIVLNLLGTIYAKVTWVNGESTHFYKGLYHDKSRWENRGMPDDLIDVLSEIFNKEEPINEHAVDNWSTPKR
ncbi:hypothetical protein FAZ19_16355 [Sphingobacterium alkalisoli]|uniref:Uncharacterized protein n=1 Tax=Sphingobacterium alkalisoli TaxID=1874115 RepID=A0A4U0GXP3_9SPHI|nr:hypothetical protein [Sphingobacterium alkalisoli]TJY63838.1 hypothetical protein FAZ19_16355 [Sphingobacterium alkalisoli]GGH24542.1 hypothetical protein GCM10011418_32540 [Sphingobacterium alkalisoli]